HVQNHAASLPILSVVVVGQDFELLDLLDRCSWSVARGNHLVGNVSTVHQIEVASIVERPRSNYVARVPARIEAYARCGGSQTDIIIHLAIDTCDTQRA